MTLTVLAVLPAHVDMAIRMVRHALVSSCVAGGRGYLVVRGQMGQDLSFVDPIDGTVLVEAVECSTREGADAWIEADVAQRSRPA